MQLTVQLFLYRLGAIWFVFLAVSVLLLYLASRNYHPNSKDPVLMKQARWLEGLGLGMLVFTALTLLARLSLQIDPVRH
jgi:multisubunit Na+/H+ antiporter MnhB subunit